MISIRKYIPDTITCMNLLCGFLGVIATFNGFYQQAFILMILASVFDFCDGLSARMLGAYSDLGKELDSLSDLVSFGVLPASMLFCTMMDAHGGLTGDAAWWVKALCFSPSLVAVFSGVRLAKFNTDSRQKDSFIGLATPSCAMLCGSMICFVSKHPESFLADWCTGLVFIPVLSLVMAYMLVCELPMFSLKFHKGDDLMGAAYIKRYIFSLVLLLLVPVVIVFHLHWSLIVTMGLLAYILINIVCFIIKK